MYQNASSYDIAGVPLAHESSVTLSIMLIHSGLKKKILQLLLVNIRQRWKVMVYQTPKERQNFQRRKEKRQTEVHDFCACSHFKPELAISCHCMCFSDTEMH